MTASTATPLDTTVNYELRSLNDDIESIIKRARTVRAHLSKASTRNMIKTFMSWKSDTVDVYTFVSGAELYVNIRVNKLEGFKDTRLEGILTSLEFMNPESNSMTENAADFSKTFSYYFYSPEDAEGRRVTTLVTLTAKIVSDSKTCERVIVGMTEGKPQPIYKLVCDGESNPAAPEDQITSDAGE